MNRLTSTAAGIALAATFIALAVAEPSPSQLPDPTITPGLVATTDQSEICSTLHGLSYSKRHRQTPLELKREIRARDGCTFPSEVDHRVPLAIGGADSRDNLWCQPGNTRWNYHDKDRLEVYTWESLCHHHTLSPTAAQLIFFAPDWTKEYCKIFTTDPRC